MGNFFLENENMLKLKENINNNITQTNQAVTALLHYRKK